MDDAANETPAPAAEGTSRPTATPATPATNFRSALLPVGTHRLRAIETWALNAAMAAMGDAGSLIDEASKHDRPGKESILTIQRIYAALTDQTASADRTALDKVFRRRDTAAARKLQRKAETSPSLERVKSLWHGMSSMHMPSR